MPTDCNAVLKAEILTALAGSSSQQPVDTVVLAKRLKRQRGRVEAALMELYQTQALCCCKIIKQGAESVVWWVAGAGQTVPISYRHPGSAE